MRKKKTKEYYQMYREKNREKINARNKEFMRKKREMEKRVVVEGAYPQFDVL
jgi:hypothetical protein